MICNGVQIVQAKKADLDIGFELKFILKAKTVSSVCLCFQSPSFVISNLLGTVFDIVKVISRYLRVEANSW